MAKYYSLKKINQKDATYNVVFGERSNGKTYACLMQALKNYFKYGQQFAYIRRWTVDVAPRRMSNLFGALIESGVVAKLSNNQFSSIFYRTGRFYVCNFDKRGKPIYSDKNVIGYAFALIQNEHNKANSYPKVTNIIFDEFISSTTYLQNEFVLFMNTISTIVRNRTDVKIYMLGNTVNKFCPYFKEMGLSNVTKQKQGTIDIYNYGDSKLKVAVEYADNSKILKKNNYYFGFDNPKLKMITQGEWEFNLYPHAPIKWLPKHIQFIYFIEFDGHIYQCEIIAKDQQLFTYIHEKTTPIKNEKQDLIYSLAFHTTMNYNRNILKPVNEVEKKIMWFFVHDRVYYQDNEVGDAIHNYIEICKRS